MRRRTKRSRRMQCVRTVGFVFGCKLYRGPGTEQHRLSDCKEWKNKRGCRWLIEDVGCGKEGLFLFLGPVILKESSIMNKPLKVSSAGGPRTLKTWNRNPRSYRGRIAIDGSFREIVNKFAKWTLMEEWHRGMTLEDLCRSPKKCKGPSRGQTFWDSFMALCKLCRPSEIFSDNIGVVRALQ